MALNCQRLRGCSFDPNVKLFVSCIISIALSRRVGEPSPLCVDRGYLPFLSAGVKPACRRLYCRFPSQPLRGTLFAHVHDTLTPRTPLPFPGTTPSPSRCPRTRCVRWLALAARAQTLKLETENEVKFNNSYQALYRQLKDVYSKIGATDFFGVVGEKFVYSRHEKVKNKRVLSGRRTRVSRRYQQASALAAVIFVLCESLAQILALGGE